MKRYIKLDEWEKHFDKMMAGCPLPKKTIAKIKQMWIDGMPTADVVEVVRCKDCKWYEPAHILHGDGSKTYVDENAPLVTADVGLNVGGQCIDHSELKISCVNHNREDPEDYEKIVIFRRPNEYCSHGERRER